MSNQEFNAAGKRVVVAGLGISGRSMAKILRDAGATVIGVDEKLKAADLHSFDDIDWDEVDLVCTSPVFNPRTPFIVEAQSRGIEVISEVEFGLAHASAQRTHRFARSVDWHHRHERQDLDHRNDIGDAQGVRVYGPCRGQHRQRALCRRTRPGQ